MEDRKTKITVDNIKSYITEIEGILSDINEEKNNLIAERNIIEESKYRNEVRVKNTIERCRKNDNSYEEIKRLEKVLYYIKNPEEREEKLEKLKKKIAYIGKYYGNFLGELKACNKMLFDIAMLSVLKSDDKVILIAKELRTIKENEIKRLEIEKEKLEQDLKISGLNDLTNIEKITIIGSKIASLKEEIANLKTNPKQTIIKIMNPTVLKPNIEPIDSRIKGIVGKIAEKAKKYQYYKEIIKEQEELEHEEWYPLVEKIFGIENSAFYGENNANNITINMSGNYDYILDKTTARLTWNGEEQINEYKIKEQRKKECEIKITELKEKIGIYKDSITSLKNRIKELQENINGKKDKIIYSNKKGTSYSKGKISQFFFKLFRKKQYDSNYKHYEEKLKNLEEETTSSINQLEEYDRLLYRYEEEINRLEQENKRTLNNNQVLFASYELVKKFNEFDEKIRKEVIIKYLNSASEITNIKPKIAKCKLDYFKYLKELSKIKYLPVEVLEQLNKIFENNIITLEQLDDIDFSNIDEASLEIINSIFEGRNCIEAIDFNNSDYKENMEYFDTIVSDYRKKYNYSGSEYEFFTEKLINDEIDMRISSREALEIVKKKTR